jgi:uncharacterized protein YidB (DUF937 family)
VAGAGYQNWGRHGDLLDDALGHAPLDDLGRKTGLLRKELLLRLNVALPEVVNRFTPQGRLPTGDEMDGLT